VEPESRHASEKILVAISGGTVSMDMG